MPKQPRILLLDIETSPNIAYMWGLWKELTSVDMIEREWYILCWCAKWLGENKVFSSALPDFKKEYKEDKEDDKHILLKLWNLLDEADMVVGHNLAAFDVKKINARFIQHKIKPPSPFKIVDTFISAKRHFDFTSNKLGDLGKKLGLGEKVETGGFKLWRKCLLGDKQAWNKMVTYCKGDILLLEKVYLRMRPYMDNHPNISLYIEDEDEAMCPVCGSIELQKHGIAFNGQGKYHRLQCSDCGAWCRLKENLMPKGKVKTVNR